MNAELLNNLERYSGWQAGSLLHAWQTGVAVPPELTGSLGALTFYGVLAWDEALDRGHPRPWRTRQLPIELVVTDLLTQLRITDRVVCLDSEPPDVYVSLGELQAWYEHLATVCRAVRVATGLKVGTWFDWPRGGYGELPIAEGHRVGQETLLIALDYAVVPLYGEFGELTLEADHARTLRAWQELSAICQAVAPRLPVFAYAWPRCRLAGDLGLSWGRLRTQEHFRALCQAVHLAGATLVVYASSVDTWTEWAPYWQIASREVL